MSVTTAKEAERWVLGEAKKKFGSTVDSVEANFDPATRCWRVSVWESSGNRRAWEPVLVKAVRNLHSENK